MQLEFFFCMEINLLTYFEYRKKKQSNTYLYPINYFKGFLLVTCAGKKEEKVEDSGMNIF